MGGYLANFTVYTMAMTGLICFAVFVYKKIMDGSLKSNNSKFLSVEETMSLNPRKTLHVVRAGNERFLIASDVDRTTLLSKLNSETSTIKTENFDRFRNIEQEPLPQFEQYYHIPQQEVLAVQTKTTTKQQVHLEPIRGKHPTGSQMRKNMDKREPVKKQNLVELDFNQPKSHGFSTMKEMAKKINEL